MNLEFHLYSKLYCAKGAKIESIMKFTQLYAAKKVSILKGSIFSDNVEKEKRTTHKKQFGAITQ